MLLASKIVSWQRESGAKTLLIVLTGKSWAATECKQPYDFRSKFFWFLYSGSGTGLMCLFGFNFRVDSIIEGEEEKQDYLIPDVSACWGLTL